MKETQIQALASKIPPVPNTPLPPFPEEITRGQANESRTQNRPPSEIRTKNEQAVFDVPLPTDLPPPLNIVSKDPKGLQTSGDKLKDIVVKHGINTNTVEATDLDLNKT